MYIFRKVKMAKNCWDFLKVETVKFFDVSLLLKTRTRLIGNCFTCVIAASIHALQKKRKWRGMNLVISPKPEKKKEKSSSFVGLYYHFLCPKQLSKIRESLLVFSSVKSHWIVGNYFYSWRETCQNQKVIVDSFFSLRVLEEKKY